MFRVGHDTEPRQYKDNDLTPAALAFFEAHDESRLQSRHPGGLPAAAATPHRQPLSLVADIIFHLLDGRSDASSILHASAECLGLLMPGLDIQPGCCRLACSA